MLRTAATAGAPDLARGGVGAHSLLRRQLAQAGIGATRTVSASRLDALVSAVSATYLALEAALRGAQAAQRSARDELAEAQRIAGLGSWQYHVGAARLEVSPELAVLLDLPVEAGVVRPDDLLHAIADEDRARALARVRRALRAPSSARGELRVVTRDGDIRWFGCGIESDADPVGRVTRLRGTFLDVSERHRAQARIERLAYHDELTGLPNRARFREHVAAAVSRGVSAGRAVAVLHVDLDRFKAINDSLGHEGGDALLVAIAGRLRSTLRDEDVLSRIGGDEFLVLVADIAGRADAAVVADKLLAGLARPLVVGGVETRLSASIGVACLPGDGEDPGALLANADAAMLAAKAQGRGRQCFYRPEMNARARGRLSLVQELRAAIETNQLVLAFQPIVRGASGRIEGVEALVRWAHPQRGIVAPGDFMPLAEETGLVDAIGEIVLRGACRQLGAWHAAGHGDLYVSVNVSPLQFASGAFVDDMVRLTAEYDLPACAVQLEITESAMMRDPGRASELLGSLRAAGTRISIDDFGTGHSSLAYLRSLPVDVIKIDRSFVVDIGSDGDDGAIVRAIVAIAASLDASVVAEGVETAGQRDSLLGLGCDRMQGFFFHKPMPAGVMSAQLAGRGLAGATDRSGSTVGGVARRRASGMSGSRTLDA